MDTTLYPYSVFLIMKGGGGDRVLFRYPFNVAPKKRQGLSEANGKAGRTGNEDRTVSFRPRSNPYALPAVTDGLFLPEDSTSSKQNSDVLQVRLLVPFVEMFNLKIRPFPSPGNILLNC